MSNSISFVGNLAADAEVKTVGAHQVVEFRVGNSVGFGDKKTTNWFRCAKWGGSDAIVKFLTKGTKVFVSGELNAREWGDEGARRTSLEVRVNALDFVGSKSPGGGSAAESNQDEDTPF